MSKNYIEKVAIVGVAGTIGTYLTSALLATGKHTVTAITREGSTNKLPSGIDIKKINYDQPETIVSALRGQDCLIITMNVMAPPEQQSKLISAAAEAGVPYIFPNEFGGDPLNVQLGNDNFLGPRKEGYRKEIEKLGVSKWVVVACGFWYQFSLAGGAVRFGFDFKEKSLVLFDEGDVKTCVSTWPLIAKAVANVLSLKIRPDGANGKEREKTLQDFTGKAIYIASFTVSQLDMFDAVLKATNGKKEDWKITKEDVRERYKTGVAEMQSGNQAGFVKMLYARDFFPESSGNFGKERGLDNEALGLPKEDLVEATKEAIEMAKKGVAF